MSGDVVPAPDAAEFAPTTRPPAEQGSAVVRIGIGGWDFAPWRGSFYPAGLKKTDELAFAAGELNSIEINATFYRTQSRASFIKWRDTVPADFVFALKAPRAAAYGTDPIQTTVSIARFLDSGVTELGSKLGPILWQFPAARRFDADKVAAFLALLPRTHDGLALRHAVEAKHASFDDPAYFALLRGHNVADCMVEAAGPARTALTADFAYLRLQRNEAAAAEGYDSPALDRWAAWIRATPMPRGTHAYFISGDKQRAPDAARALRHRLARIAAIQE